MEKFKTQLELIKIPFQYISNYWNAHAGIRIKYIVGVFPLFLMGVLPLMYFFVSRADFLLREGLKDKLALIEKNLTVIVKNSLQESSFSSLNTLVSSISKQDKEIVSIVVLDQSLTVVATSNEKKYPIFYKFSDPALNNNIMQQNKDYFYSHNDKMLNKLTFVQLDEVNSNEITAEDSVSKDDEIIENIPKDVQKQQTIQGVIVISLTSEFLEHEVRKLQLWSLMALIVVLSLGFWIAYFISGRMSQPLVLLADKVKEIASGNLGVHIHLEKQRGDEIGNLFTNINVMRLAIKSLTGNLEDTVRERTSQLHVAQEENVRILETMTSGLFSIDQNYFIGSQYSKITENIFEVKKLGQVNFLDTLKGIISEEKFRMFQKYMTILYNPGIVDHFVPDLNPIKNVEGKFSHGIKYLEFSFLRIKDTDKKIIGIMVLVSDITKAYLLNQKLVEQERIMNTQVKEIHAILHVDPTFLSVFITDSEDDMKRISELTSKADMSLEEIGEIYRIVHSIKGNASILHLDFISSVAHQGEEKIIIMQKKSEITNSDISEINSISESLRKALDGMNELIEQLKKFKSDFQESTSDISQMTMKSIVEMIDKLSTSVNKSVETDLSNFDYGFINKNTRKVIKDILVQMVRNSISHGIEEFKDRKEAGKPVTAKISLSTKKDEKYFWCLVQDDGQGLSLDKLREKAVSMKIAPSKEVYTWDDKKVFDLIFIPGFSTKDKADMNSGRGVGMDIIKDSIEKLGGVIQIQSEQGKFMRIYIGLPLSLYNES